MTIDPGVECSWGDVPEFKYSQILVALGEAGLVWNTGRRKLILNIAAYGLNSAYVCEGP